ncbi:MAG: GNAT family N-acetyltransferase [SAR324 cluster bacterium]|nr:GNAT family N-acetyltransferase [SAR324 cluster bacterium]
MPESLLSIEPALGTHHVSLIRTLFSEYQKTIGIDLEYQGFEEELAGLPEPYCPPDGGLFIGRIGRHLAGCVAFKRLEAQNAEMKRLYVRPQHQSSGLGRRLVLTVIDQARKAKYTKLRLDTLPDMAAAQALYQKLGFEEIPPYSRRHLPGTQFYELHLKVS